MFWEAFFIYWQLQHVVKRWFNALVLSEELNNNQSPSLVLSNSQSPHISSISNNTSNNDSNESRSNSEHKRDTIQSTSSSSTSSSSLGYAMSNKESDHNKKKNKGYINKKTEYSNNKNNYQDSNNSNNNSKSIGYITKKKTKSDINNNNNNNTINNNNNNNQVNNNSVGNETNQTSNTGNIKENRILNRELSKLIMSQSIGPHNDMLIESIKNKDEKDNMMKKSREEALHQQQDSEYKDNIHQSISQDNMLNSSMTSIESNYSNYTSPYEAYCSQPIKPTHLVNRDLLNSLNLSTSSSSSALYHYDNLRNNNINQSYDNQYSNNDYNNNNNNNVVKNSNNSSNINNNSNSSFKDKIVVNNNNNNHSSLIDFKDGKFGCSIGWNDTFQRLLLLPEDDQAKKFIKYKHLSSLSKDFLHSAITYGKIIIEEAFLDKKYKTIKSVQNIGGQAGGEKYIYNGILFKFASDWIGIYGNDEYSMKAGGHELKSIMRYYGHEGIHVPLMALLDYRGFRLVAMSILPIIPSSTIVYGSGDGGKNVYAQKPEVNEKMRQAASKLNVKGHLCGIGSSKAFLYGPTDIEGHMGLDGLFYVLDFARVFPPTAEKRVEETFLYRLFRPEFVQTYHIPLSSDSYSPFGKVDPTAMAVNNGEVKEATEYLYGVCIPKVASWMDTHVNTIHWLSQLTEIVHREGINARYLGLIRHHVTEPLLKRVLLTEIVARVFKNLIRAELREKMKEMKSIEADSYIQVVMDFFNIVLGDPPIKHERLWCNTIKHEILIRFDNSLSAMEKENGFDLKSQIDIVNVFVRLQNMTGIKLADESMSEMRKDPVSFRVVLSDITSMDVKVKHMNIISLAEGTALSLQCTMNNSIGGKTGSERLFKLATNKFEEAIRSTPDNKDILNDYANVLKQLALSVGKTDSLLYLERSYSNFLLANNYNSLIQLGDLLYSLYLNHLKNYNNNQNNNNNNEGDESLLWERKDYLWRHRNQLMVLAEKCYAAVACWGAETRNSLLNSSIEIISRRSTAQVQLPNETKALALLKLASLLTSRALDSHSMATYIQSGKYFKEAFKMVLKDSLLWTKFPVPESIVSRSPDQVACWAQLFINQPILSESSFPSLITNPIIHTHVFKREILVPDFLLYLSKTHSSQISYLSLRKYPIAMGVHYQDLGSLAVHMVRNLGESLIKLDLSTLSWLEDDLISSLTSHCINLTSINVSESGVQSKGLLHLLQNSKKLLRIKASGCRLEDRDLASIISPVPNQAPIEFKLQCLDVSSTDIRSIGSILNVLPHLRHINVSHCPNILPMEISKMSFIGLKLEKINLSSCPMVNDESVNDLIRRLNNLTWLSVGGCKISTLSLLGNQRVCQQIEYLDASHCKLKLIPDTLPSLSNLRCIRVSNSSIPIETMLEMLSKCKHLEELVYNNIGDTYGVTDSGSHFKRNFSNSSFTSGQPSHQYHHQNINHQLNSTIINNLPSKLQLKTLELQASYLPWQDLESILMRSPMLETLNISQMHDLDNVIFVSISKFCTHLINVDLSYCKSINDSSIELLVSSCRQIKSLALNGCHLITDNSINAISTHLHHLTHLKLKKCPLIADLVGLATQCTFLTSVDLSMSENISDQSVYKLLSQSNLKHINIYGCKRVTDESIRVLMNYNEDDLYNSSSGNSSSSYNETGGISLKSIVLGHNKTSDPAIEALRHHRTTLNIANHSSSTLASSTPQISGSTGILMSPAGVSSSNTTPNSVLLSPSPSQTNLTSLLNRQLNQDSNNNNNSNSTNTSSGNLLPIISSATKKSLMADLKNIKMNPIPLVSAEPIDSSDLLTWHANIVAPVGSLFEGGIFHLELKFPTTYPVNPPSGVLLTPFPHPHVHDRGRICLDILSDFQGYFQGNSNNGDGTSKRTTGWSSAYSVQTILLQIQTFLITLDDEEEGGSIPIQEYLLRIPDAIANSRSFKCSSCPHTADTPWPSLPNDINGVIPSITISSNQNNNQSNNSILGKTNDQLLNVNDKLAIDQYKSPPSSPNNIHNHIQQQQQQQLEEDTDFINAIESELVCYHTRVTYKEDVLGIGINIVNKTPRSPKIDDVIASLDLLSYDAFNQGGVRTSVLKETFNHWLPVYINQQHGARAWDLLESSLSSIFQTKKFRPQIAKQFLCKAMNSMCVQMMNETLHASIKLLEGYCWFHQLFLAFVKKYPDLLVEINKEIYDFIHLPSKRHKKDTPALGEFLPLLTVSDYKWSEVVYSYLEENFDRNVMWIIKKTPSFGSTQDDPEFDKKRPKIAMEASIVSIRLLLFHVYFLQHIARPEGSTLDSISNQYNRLYGKPPRYVRDNLQIAVKDIMRVNTWDDFFTRIGITPPSEQDLIEWHKRSILNSISKGYHKKSNTNTNYKPQLQVPPSPNINNNNNQNQNQKDKKRNNNNNRNRQMGLGDDTGNSSNYYNYNYSYNNQNNPNYQTNNYNQRGWNNNSNYQQRVVSYSQPYLSQDEDYYNLQFMASPPGDMVVYDYNNPNGGYYDVGNAVVPQSAYVPTSPPPIITTTPPPSRPTFSSYRDSLMYNPTGNNNIQPQYYQNNYNNNFNNNNNNNNNTDNMYMNYGRFSKK